MTSIISTSNEFTVQGLPSRPMVADNVRSVRFDSRWKRSYPSVALSETTYLVSVSAPLFQKSGADEVIPVTSAPARSNERFRFERRRLRIGWEFAGRERWEREIERDGENGRERGTLARKRVVCYSSFLFATAARSTKRDCLGRVVWYFALASVLLVPRCSLGVPVWSGGCFVWKPQKKCSGTFSFPSSFSQTACSCSRFDLVFQKRKCFRILWRTKTAHFEHWSVVPQASFPS